MMMDRGQFMRTLGLGAGWLAAGKAAATEVAAPGAWAPVLNTASPLHSWADVRAQYSISEELVYLNCGGLGPSPRQVLDIQNLTSRAFQHRVETGHYYFEEARKIVAGFVKADGEEICFTRNATEGNSIIASGLALRADDEVIFETHAHPGGSLPWVNRAKQTGIKLQTFVPDAESAEGNLARIVALITPRTRVIQVSHITAPTGLVMPVAAIAALARERGIWFHIDGAQSLGMVPVDLTGIGCDSYAASGHKWLGAPRETGILFVRRDRIEQIAPMAVGAYSSGDFDFQGQLTYAQGVRRHEYGTRDAASVVALAEAARFQLALGRKRIAARGAELATRLVQGLTSLPRVSMLTPAAAPLRAAMVTFAVEGMKAAPLFGHLLEQHRLRCRPVTE
ncbi:MAG: aminotransferase class V-fold PLP-dependent enzyme, partial [Candidatus Didemnitutus sp.]|nr:aminotransferase class V-fold PLP-dependent enzyme [Candidatus Didemnitutus sp.]